MDESALSWISEQKSKQSIEKKQQTRDGNSKLKRKPFRASPVFLSFLCPLIILNYMGSIIDVEDTQSLSMLPATLRENMHAFRIVSAIIFVVWFSMVVSWGVRKNRVFFRKVIEKVKQEADKEQSRDTEDHPGHCGLKLTPSKKIWFKQLRQSLPSILYVMFIALIGKIFWSQGESFIGPLFYICSVFCFCFCFFFA